MAEQPKPYTLAAAGSNLRGAPKPISIASLDAADITGLTAAITAAVTAYLVGLTGYDDTEVQTLKNDTGSLEWVTDSP
jgi:hypothetical protein